jgi:L-threonylcarbamoyladenylate synthase
LRLGAISLESLREQIPSIQPPSATRQLEGRSPGLRHKHYAPHARVRFYDATAHADPQPKAYIGITAAANLEAFDRVLLCRDTDHYAHELFHFFRSCERTGINVIYCERPAPTGIGSALSDRIQRAGEVSRNERD